METFKSYIFEEASGRQRVLQVKIGIHDLTPLLREMFEKRIADKVIRIASQKRKRNLLSYRRILRRSMQAMSLSLQNRIRNDEK